MMIQCALGNPPPKHGTDGFEGITIAWGEIDEIFPSSMIPDASDGIGFGRVREGPRDPTGPVQADRSHGALAGHGRGVTHLPLLSNEFDEAGQDHVTRPGSWLWNVPSQDRRQVSSDTVKGRTDLVC